MTKVVVTLGIGICLTEFNLIMTLTKTIEQDQLEVIGPYKAIGIQEKTVIKENDKEISSSIHRRILNCGDLDANDNLVPTDVSSEAADVQTLCNTYWTTAVKDAWKANLIATKPPTDNKGFGE